MSIEPIAIVGASCRLPGGANDLQSLWELFAHGKETWSPVPSDRFNEAAFHHPDGSNPNGTNNHLGGHFIDGDVRDFDNSFFHLSPQQAAGMDPQQRILLELAYEAIENAGWTLEQCVGSRTAVFAAIFGMDYERNLTKDVLDLPVYQSVGTGAAILANRISHAFDLRGPSITIDTGCSGGLVALHSACQSLRSGESEAALVASANLQLMPDHYIGMSNQKMLSSQGRCFPFDVRGDGYGRGEGFAVVALKRLSTALRDHDPIHSIILNTGLNQDGYTPSGITHPNSLSQAALIRETYSRIGLRPEDIVYVEAHGTGTKAGDKEELSAISEVFEGPARRLPLYVGSNKGSIGHTESTSGLASLLKAVLMLKNETIPPVAGFSKPKPGLPLHGINIPTKQLPWPHSDTLPPRISINSFGYGGTNAHAILEKRPQQYPYCLPTNGLTPYPRLFVFSAKSQISLRSLLQAYVKWLEQHPGVSLSDLSYTLCHRRSALQFRLHVVAAHVPSLIHAIQQGSEKLSSKLLPSKKRSIFVFSGQGAQWPRMGHDLFLGTTPSPIFRNSIRLSRDILRGIGATWDLEIELARESGESRINEAEIAQPATTAIQIALVDLLRSQGVYPSAVVGHSSGEIAAAYTAGRLSHHAALCIAFHRGFMAGASKRCGLPNGAMLSVGLGEDDAAFYLQDLEHGRAVIACINSPRSVTISGDANAIDEIKSRLDLRGDGTFARKLLVDTAYHSYHMLAVADQYRTRLEDLDSAVIGEQTAEKITFISSVTGEEWTSGFPMSYWVDNLVSPVRFSQAVQKVAEEHYKLDGGLALFVEIGPHPALAGPVRQCLTAPHAPKIAYDYSSPLKRGTEAVESVLQFDGHLFECRVSLKFNNVSNLVQGSDSAVALQNLPSYVWDHSKKHWHESRLSRDYRLRSQPYHDLLGVRMTELTTIEPRWRHMVNLATLPWLADHVIDGLIIFPGAGYVCMVLEAILQISRELYPDTGLEAVSFQNISFLRALVIPDTHSRIEMQLGLKQISDNNSLAYRFSVTAHSDGKWSEFCTGHVQAVTTHEDIQTETAMVDTKYHKMFDGIELLPEQLYREMDDDGNTYGQAFRGLHSIKVSVDASQAEAVIEVPDIAARMPSQHQSTHVLHPTTFDIMFHVGIPMIKRLHGKGSTMPVRIGKMLVSVKHPSLSRPRSRLNVQAVVTSSQFRTSTIDMVTFNNGQPVLSALGIESRSLAAHVEKASSVSDKQGICYELTWKPDLSMLRAIDLPSSPTLADIASLIGFRAANLLVAELGEKLQDTAQEFLTSLNVSGGTIAVYDVIQVSNTPKLANSKRSLSYPSRHYVLNAMKDFESQNIPRNLYDAVLVADISLLKYIPGLLKDNGVAIITLESDAQHSLATALQQHVSNHSIQLSFSHANTGHTVVLVRCTKRAKSLPKINSHLQILTHSQPSNTPSWATDLIDRLNDMGFDTSRGNLHDTNILSHADIGDGCTIVIDDLAEPILSDQSYFENALNVLQRGSLVIWLSPDSPAPMFQITGAARTAHAENDGLRLTTIHSALDAIATPRVADLLYHCIYSLINADQSLDREREYYINASGSVLIPRLHHSMRLNNAIRDSKSATHIESELFKFTSNSRSIALASSKSLSSSEVLFIDVPEEDLAPDAIEIETEAFVLSRPQGSAETCLGEYVGITKRVGRDVNGIAPGDTVMAITLGAAIGANRPHVLGSNTILKPLNIPSSVAAAIYLSVLGATFVLQNLATLPSSATILIHGVLTDMGRATVAVAKTLGLKFVVTAGDFNEASAITEQLDIQAQKVIVDHPALLRPRYDSVLHLDAIINIGDELTSSTIWNCLKPFGQVIMLNSSQTSPMTDLKPPRNATIHFYDILEIFQTYPDRIADLKSVAKSALKSFPLKGMKTSSHDVSQISEASRLLRQHNKVILQPSLSSMVLVASPQLIDESWKKHDVSYVVAGGMGDLGKRLLVLLASRGAMHLVTLSRRKVGAESYSAFQAELQNARPGCRLYCISCDITSEKSVQDAAALIAKSGAPPVRGVIQSAVSLQDRTLETMTWADWLAVTRAKVHGTLALEKAFASPQLDFFLMLSSAVCITGASGQANYNAGNAVQDAMAHSHGRGFLSMNIGWIENAVNTADNKTILQGLWRTGLRPILPEELEGYFDYILGAASSHSPMRQAVIGFNTESLSHTSANNSNVKSPLFCHVRGKTTANKDPSSENEGSFEAAVRSGDSVAIAHCIGAGIIGQLAVLISLDPSQINDQSGSMLDFGLDSLVAIELRNWITRQFEAPLQSSEILADQTIYDLAKKVASRSSLVISGSGSSETTEDSIENKEVTDGSQSESELSRTPASSTTETYVPKLPESLLPNLPLPELKEILESFKKSRRAIDTTEQMEIVTAAASKLLNSDDGSELHQYVQEMGAEAIADAYDRQVYLAHREPIPEQGPWTLIHPKDGAEHTQAQRAAILTVSAIDFAKKLSSGDIMPGTLHGNRLSTEGYNWLFNSTRRPGVGVDWMQRHASNCTIAVLRRGFVFELRLPSDEEPLDFQHILLAYENIISAATESQHFICTLTADERDSWAMLRQDLEQEPQNASALACIDTAMFVMCLDDASPETPAERFTHFVLNGSERAFSNRWLDKPLQIAVTANGRSAETYEHSKLDGLDSRALHSHLVQAVLSSESNIITNSSTTHSKYAVVQHFWKPSHAASQRVEHVWTQCRSYGPLDYQTYNATELGLKSARVYRMQPNAAAHLTVLLALYLVDGQVRPAWEKVSLGAFHRGRVEWVQTMSEAAQAFVEAAAGDVETTESKASTAQLLRQAMSAHSRALITASRGYGTVGPLYALRAAALNKQQGMPELFETEAWNATRRGGPGQDVKLGFMRMASDEDGQNAMAKRDHDIVQDEEAGFLVNGERGVYIHCNVWEKHARFAVSGRPSYVARVCQTMDQAVNIVISLLKFNSA